MKATQAKAPEKPPTLFTCVVCKKQTDKPYGFVRHGEACTCCKSCDIAYYRRSYPPQDLLRRKT